MGETLRSERFKENSMLTIAHRLNTIVDYDRVMVLDNGEVAEFGPPKALVSNTAGSFRSLIDATGASSSAHLLSIINGRKTD